MLCREMKIQEVRIETRLKEVKRDKLVTGNLVSDVSWGRGVWILKSD